MHDDEITKGTEIAYRYQLGELLGKGGMARVFVAQDMPNGMTPVAMKIMFQGWAEQDRFRALFQKEIKTIKRLEQHEHIVKIYDASSQLNPLCYYTMELIDGGNLRRYINETNEIPLYEVILLTKQISDALAFAHKKEIFHRDVKPANILLKHKPSNNGHIYGVLADFGLAKLAEDAAEVDGEAVSSPGAVKGTYHYMAPEQIQSERADGRTDIYSLGVVLYELIAGKLPFGADLAVAKEEVYRMHLEAMPPSLEGSRPDLPPSLIAIVERALQKAREDRYPTADEMSHALSQVLEDLDGPGPLTEIDNEYYPRPIVILPQVSAPFEEEPRTEFDEPPTRPGPKGDPLPPETVKSETLQVVAIPPKSPVERLLRELRTFLPGSWTIREGIAILGACLIALLVFFGFRAITNTGIENASNAATAAYQLTFASTGATATKVAGDISTQAVMGSQTAAVMQIATPTRTATATPTASPTLSATPMQTIDLFPTMRLPGTNFFATIIKQRTSTIAPGPNNIPNIKK